MYLGIRDRRSIQHVVVIAVEDKIQKVTGVHLWKHSISNPVLRSTELVAMLLYVQFRIAGHRTDPSSHPSK